MQKKPIITIIKTLREIRDSSAQENPWKFWNKPVKIWNKPVTLSKAFKKRHGWRITYLTLNPPLPECRFFIFGALPMPQWWLDAGKATLLHSIVRLWLCGSSGKVRVVWEAADHDHRGVLGKKIVGKGSWGRS